MAAWALVAFGGVPFWAAIPLAAAALLLLIVVRPSIGRGRARALDVALVVWLGAAALQILPVPVAIAERVSPASVRLAGELSLAAPSAFATFSIRASHTAHSLLVLLSALLVFWMARETFRAGGVRTFGRGVACLGFVVSLVALAQHATAGRLIYWTWPTAAEGPPPFGPFVNRNHFATWIVLAIPLCLGYLAARSAGPDTRDVRRPLRARLARGADPRAVWLLAATGTMALALAFTQSRSGLAALGVALAIGFGLTRGRADTARRRGAGVVAALAVLGAAFAWNLPAIMSRFERAATGYADRAVIWRETLPIVHDFWLTGSGLGTFKTTMAFYQQADRTWFFNQAHSEYLQLASEGGLLLLLPVAGAAVAFVRLAAGQLRDDRTGMFWMRAGAAAGLAGLAFQSIWENGLRIPANAVLAAGLAAIVIHEPHRHRPTP